MSVALPFDFYDGGKDKCGARVVVVFESSAGKPWSGARNNLTLRVVDAFGSENSTDADQTILLSNTAWRIATGNSTVNSFESWPIRWYYVDAEYQNETMERYDESSDDDTDDSCV